MKQKDWLTIAVITVVAGMFSFFIANWLFSSDSKRKATVPSVGTITSDFPRPSENKDYQAFYNSNALNPTQLITIGDNPNTSPFGTLQ